MILYKFLLKIIFKEIQKTYNLKILLKLTKMRKEEEKTDFLVSTRPNTNKINRNTYAVYCVLFVVFVSLDTIFY